MNCMNNVGNGCSFIWILLLLPHRHTVEFLCLCYGVSWAIGTGLFLLYYRWGGWEKRGLQFGAARTQNE